MNNKQKAKTNKKSALRLYQIAIIIVIILAIAVVFSIFLFVKRDDEKPDNTSVVSGKITEKRISCGLEGLRPDGSIKTEASLCDGGNSLVINGMIISTGGGALTPYPEYISDIDALHAGDSVEVRYVKNTEGRASTNCRTCYVKKEGSLEPEVQTYIEKQAPRLKNELPQL